jgi:hypothetical protein
MGFIAQIANGLHVFLVRSFTGSQNWIVLHEPGAVQQPRVFVWDATNETREPVPAAGSVPRSLVPVIVRLSTRQVPDPWLGSLIPARNVPTTPSSSSCSNNSTC